MATKIRLCVHCGHSFKPVDRGREFHDPNWHPVASVYCSHYCSAQFHCDLGHHFSTRSKDKARRHTAKAV